MGLEAANFISELVPSNPLDTDDPTQGAAQIRTTKLATQQSFPNINSAVNATPAELNQLVNLVLRELAPTGIGAEWFTSTPPDGWLECNGAPIPVEHTALILLLGANTPNLSDRFLRGSSGGRAPLSTQGENVGAHSHNSDILISTAPFGEVVTFNRSSDSAAQALDSTVTSNNPTGEVRPANTAVMFIVKT